MKNRGDVKMPALATKEQIEYIEKLQSQIGTEKQIVKGMSSYEASKLISELIAKTAKTKINEDRLAMAMNEVFRIWKKDGRDIYQHHREAFIDEVINAYGLFTEISDRLAKGAGCQNRNPHTHN
jgi:hypothetical protein